MPGFWKQVIALNLSQDDYSSCSVKSGKTDCKKPYKEYVEID